MINYVDVISKHFPNLQVSISGDPSVYENIVVEVGGPLPTKEELDAKALLDTKDRIWRQIQAERDRRKAGGVLVGGYWFHSDDTSRIQHLGLMAMGSSMPTNIMWKTMSGEFVQMTPTLASQIFQAVVTFDIQVFSVAEQKRAAMEASADPESYVWNVSWPAIFGE